MNTFLSFSPDHIIYPYLFQKHIQLCSQKMFILTQGHSQDLGGGARFFSDLTMRFARGARGPAPPPPTKKI